MAGGADVFRDDSRCFGEVPIDDLSRSKSLLQQSLADLRDYCDQLLIRGRQLSAELRSCSVRAQRNALQDQVDSATVDYERRCRKVAAIEAELRVLELAIEIKSNADFYQEQGVAEQLSAWPLVDLGQYLHENVANFHRHDLVGEVCLRMVRKEFHRTRWWRRAALASGVLAVLITLAVMRFDLSAWESGAMLESSPRPLASVGPAQAIIKVLRPKPGAIFEEGDDVVVLATAQPGRDRIALKDLSLFDRRQEGRIVKESVARTDQGVRRYEWRLKDLAPGQHSFRVVAQTQVNAAREDIEFQVVPRQGRLLLVALSAPYCANLADSPDRKSHDAFDLIDAVETTFAGHHRQLASWPNPRKDGLCTWEATRDALNWLKSQMTSRDTALVLYSGHGVLEQGQLYLTGINSNTKDPLLTCARFEDLVRDFIKPLPGKQIIVLDCCHAEAGFEALQGLKRSADRPLLALAACEAQHKAVRKSGRGQLSMALIEAWKARPDQPRFDAVDLLASIRAQLPDVRGHWTPQSAGDQPESLSIPRPR